MPSEDVRKRNVPRHNDDWPLRKTTCWQLYLSIRKITHSLVCLRLKSSGIAYGHKLHLPTCSYPWTSCTRSCGHVILHRVAQTQDHLCLCFLCDSHSRSCCCTEHVSGYVIRVASSIFGGLLLATLNTYDEEGWLLVGGVSSPRRPSNHNSTVVITAHAKPNSRTSSRWVWRWECTRVFAGP